MRGAELVDVLAPEPGRIAARGFREHVRVRELLIQLQRELEIRRRPLRPFLHRRDRGHAIERRVHLHGVEVLGVKGELVELGRAARAARRLGGIEDAVPGAFAGGIAPAGRPDADVGLAGRSCGAHCARYSSFLNPKTTFAPRTRIGRLIRFGCSSIRSMASFLVRGSARCLEYRAARAHEIEKAVFIDVFFEKGPVRRFLVDVALDDVDALFGQKTSGVAAGRSSRLPVEDRLRHVPILAAPPVVLRVSLRHAHGFLRRGVLGCLELADCIWSSTNRRIDMGISRWRRVRRIRRLRRHRISKRSNGDNADNGEGDRSTLPLSPGGRSNGVPACGRRSRRGQAPEKR